jgi:ribosomal protein L40E
MAIVSTEKSAEDKKIKLTTKQMVALAVSFVVTLTILMSGIYMMFGCLAMIIVAVLLYMVPHLVKIKNIKVMVIHGAVFAIVALLAGSLYTSPAYVDSHSEFQESGDFTGATYNVTSDSYDFDVTYTDTDAAHKPVATVSEIDMVGFSSVYGVKGSERTIDPVSYDQTTGTATFDVQVGDGLYIIYFYMADTSNSDAKVSDSQSVTFFLEDLTSSSAKNSIYWIGTGYYLGLCMLLYFMILFLTYGMRSSAEKTRDRMVKQGRLYPPGYGRCKQCDSVVLPGEIKCRKCGAYIDVPAEIKPEKKDFFICSDCGAEVPDDAEKCPKCGASFDDDVEVEVQHADGTVEIAESTFDCPECGKEVPSASEFCPKCGKKFDGRT